MLKCNINEQRIKFGCSRAWLARECKIPYSTMCSLCRGDFKQLQYRHLEALCRVLRCTPGDLLDYRKEK